MCLVCASGIALSGCSTSYVPRPSPRVAIVMQGGTPGYLREGRVYPGGGFGGDIDEAVRGNPEAESHARAYRAGMIGGFAATLGGVASTLGGGLLYFRNTGGPESERDTTEQAVGGVLALSGIAAYVAGLVLLTNAQPHLWDAINSYNDGVSDGGGPPRPYGPYAPPPYVPNAPGAAPAWPNAPGAPSPSLPNAPAPPAPTAPPGR